jgi:hypothetical protein
MSICFYFQENLFQRKRRKREIKTATKGGVEVRIKIPEKHLCLTEKHHTHISLPKQSEDW